MTITLECCFHQVLYDESTMDFGKKRIVSVLDLSNSQGEHAGSPLQFIP